MTAHFPLQFDLQDPKDLEHRQGIVIVESIGNINTVPTHVRHHRSDNILPTKHIKLNQGAVNHESTTLSPKEKDKTALADSWWLTVVPAEGFQPSRQSVLTWV